MNSLIFNSINKIINIPQPPFRYYQWLITKVLVTGDIVQSAQFVFQIDGIDQSMSGVTVTNPGGRNPVNESPPNLVDGNIFGTKWLDFNMASSSNNYSIIIFDFGVGQTRQFNGYRWATANDSNNRDPVSWKIFGSNDTINWNALSIVQNFTPTSNRNTWQTPITY